MEYIVEVPKFTENDSKIEIGVDKVGGGTLGSSHKGTWEISHYVNGRLLGTEDMITGSPKTHEEAAKIYAGYLAAYAEGSDVADRLSLFQSD